ncbi:Carboxypeptidase regulatory-like domain protein [uncultured archaeon]|nr:Carboxypeptidase regulatory-like domain protein [uncultured archaeon]
MNKKLTYMLLLLTVVAMMGVPQASAFGSFLNTFDTKYPGAVGSRIDSCLLCHTIPNPTSGNGPRNPYGLDFQNNGENAAALATIEPLDSDNDGFINVDEIHNLTFPGNATDFPPKITSFSPATPLSDDAPATETFSIVVNQVVDTVTWFLDGNLQKTENSVSASNFAVTTSVPILHNVTAVAQRTGDGSAMQKWDWTVIAPAAKNFNISGFKINDTNGNGVWDSGEAGLPGWSIALNCIVCGTVIDTTTTDANGFYQFTNVSNGSYIVIEEIKPGWKNTSAASQPVTVAGQDINNVNFTNQQIQPGSIAGTVTNASGSAISGAAVTANGITATTDASGNYSIIIAPGTYSVTASATNYQSNTVTGVVVTSGTVTTQNFALTPTVTAPKLTLSLNTTMDGMSTPIVNNITTAVLLDTSGSTVATATLPDNMTAQFILSGISPGDYFIEVNGLAGDLLPTRIDSNASDINQAAGLRLRNSIIGSFSNPIYRIKVYPSGLNSHPVVNYATGLNETIYSFVIVPGSTSRIEVRVLSTSAELSHFSTTNTNHDGLSDPFQTWILDFPGTQTNHGRVYNNTDSNCSGCHGNLDTKAANFSDITASNGWCFKCHYGKTGPRNGFVDPTVVVAPNGTIAGTVTNASSTLAISGATVTAGGMTATTDASGNYSIIIAPGTYSVTASATNYQSSTVTGVAVTANTVTTQNFALTPIVPSETGSISGNMINVATNMGIPNVNIMLVGIVGKGVDTKSIRMEITTDSTGMWEFDNLPAGRYIITEELPAGFMLVTPPVMNIMLAQGQNSMNDFKVNPISALMPPMPTVGS